MLRLPQPFHSSTLSAARVSGGGKLVLASVGIGESFEKLPELGFAVRLEAKGYVFKLNIVGVPAHGLFQVVASKGVHEFFRPLQIHLPYSFFVRLFDRTSLFAYRFIPYLISFQRVTTSGARYAAFIARCKRGG